MKRENWYNMLRQKYGETLIKEMQIIDSKEDEVTIDSKEGKPGFIMTTDQGDKFIYIPDSVKMLCDDCIHYKVCSRHYDGTYKRVVCEFHFSTRDMRDATFGLRYSTPILPVDNPFKEGPTCEE